MKNLLELSRWEYRFLLLPEAVANFLDEVCEFMQQIRYEQPITRTVYLNSDNYAVPWGYSLRLRKYLSHYSNPIQIDPGEAYRLEIKVAGDNHRREKTLLELPLKEAIAYAQDFLGDHVCEPLRPYTVAEYQRLHFVPRHGEGLRLTVDRDTRYSFFSFAVSNDRSIPIGREDFARVEIKLGEGGAETAAHAKLLSLLEKYRSLPVISKRETANSLVGRYIDLFGDDFFKELSRCEVESKFLLDHPNPAALLIGLKKMLLKSGPYFLPQAYPYIQQAASINHYWGRRDGGGKLCDGLKLQLYGKMLRPIFKRDTEVRLTAVGRIPVLVRREVKEAPFVYTPEDYRQTLADAANSLGELSPVGYVYRLRRAFWPENFHSKRIFHISIDEISSPTGKKMYQLEVEYTGRHHGGHLLQDPQAAQDEIVNEVGELSAIVLDFCNRDRECLKPTTLTKFDWLTQGG